jgi:hypothetical protein
MAIDPVTGWTLVKGVAEATNKLYEIAKGLKDREAKQRIDEVLDELREFKKQTAELEDQNRDLREKLRFKGGDFDFKSPFWYEKAHPERALCPKCFAKQIVVPVGEQHQEESGYTYRRCLHCETNVEVARGSVSAASPYGGGGRGGSEGWME